MIETRKIIDWLKENKATVVVVGSIVGKALMDIYLHTETPKEKEIQIPVTGQNAVLAAAIKSYSDMAQGASFDSSRITCAGKIYEMAKDSDSNAIKVQAIKAIEDIMKSADFMSARTSCQQYIFNLATE